MTSIFYRIPDHATVEASFAEGMGGELLAVGPNGYPLWTLRFTSDLSPRAKHYFLPYSESIGEWRLSDLPEAIDDYFAVAGDNPDGCKGTGIPSIEASIVRCDFDEPRPKRR